MSIDYVKRTRTTPAAPAVQPAVTGQVGRDLAYWVAQYRALTGQIQAAEVTNHDQWRKERVNVRELYSRRASAAARMADCAERLVGSGTGPR